MAVSIRREKNMKFGLRLTSQPNTDVEHYPYQSLHSRVTTEALLADKLGFDTIWLAEHHFTDHYGIMPDVFVYAAYLAAQTKKARIGTAVVTLPLASPIRVVENTALVDILSNGRFSLGIGSGYRPYEFEAFGRDFDNRRDAQEEAVEIILDGLLNKRVAFAGKHFSAKIEGEYEFYPHSLQKPHPPIFMAGATPRSIKVAGEKGFGLFLSGLSAVKDLGPQAKEYRDALKLTPPRLANNPAFGAVDICRWLYVAETDEQARRDTEAGVIRQFKQFFTGHTPGYLGNVAPELQSSNSCSPPELRSANVAGSGRWGSH
jgi:alkanesulfonate monooxygenase SsuD/methylene tetrahydromethanopterin reductase-like flavin-dependent oxidoreductase (luciferase family)